MESFYCSIILLHYFNILHSFRASFTQILNFVCTLYTNNLFTYFTGVIAPVSFTKADLASLAFLRSTR